ncbi:formin-like protein 14 isoform X3 [Carassius auratus]|uniref:Formin-like protein 14 isoform X3 n=1 Tax=Carassius auratus TaxID=7957 RepID=A0A6P6RGW7_CARAU|nr:formin-like protein 14 isoform X3 [Carassius auratus]
MLPFAIVEFINSGGLAVIPTKWFIGPEEDECYWPPARMNMAKAVIEQQDPHTDWATYKLTVKRKVATYEIARTKLVEYEQNTDVPTESDSTENMGRGKRKKRRVILSSDDEDDVNWSGSQIRPTPPSTLRSVLTPAPPPSTLRSVLTPPPPPSTLRSVLTPPPPPSTLRSVLTPPPPPSTLRSVLTPPPPPSTLRSVLTPAPPPSTLRSVLTPPPPPSTLRSVLTPPPPPSTLSSSPSSARPTLPPPLGNLRWPDVSTHHHVTMSPETSQRQIRGNMFVRILTLIEEMKETQKIQGRMLQTLLQQRGNIGTTFSSTPEGFPLKTVRDVEIMEEKLANPNFMSELVAAVTDIGGGTVDEATKRMMTFLLDHGLSRQYNFVGRNGKREFKALKLYEVIYGGLKKNAMTSQITRKDAEKAVSKWLIGARDRGGNRQARQSTPQQGLQASGSFEVERN